METNLCYVLAGNEVNDETDYRIYGGSARNVDRRGNG
jgi:hypothetical protein